MEGTMAEIRLFAGNFAPRNWAYCQGQLLSIAQNSALFSLLGTTYGGDGRTTFGLPDLRGRTMTGVGHGPGLINVNLGMRTGNELNYMNTLTLPSHTHTASISHSSFAAVSIPALADAAGTTDPTTHILATGEDSAGGEVKLYSSDAADTTLGQFDAPIASGSILVGTTGASHGTNNIQPSLALNYVICMYGVFPSRS